ncbi:M15 family metallopeptidase [Geobacillus sp. PK12]|uniref:M15 family metallopeptidase n=1 Tax=Geobacillus sp. PK12 TaxID=2508525 RepID=UPI00101329F3|nr:M15 family metallopeptidase [Geobacillus sp. PK12]RXS88151.1 dipeptidase [Geobacillus sp. PK12]
MKELRKILMSDPLVSSMNVCPSQEPFVDLVHFDPDIVVDPSLSNRSRYFSFVRLSVANKLSLAKKFLPKGIRFLIKEGYRPLHIQKRAFERALQRVKENSSNQDLDHLMAEASKYVAPPEVAPHPTGGAVDLTLIDSNGSELDLGTPYDAIPQETDNATFFDATNISVQAMQNRQILAHALQSVGFVNYFTEWWHWSYGDRYWAVMTNVDHALYHPVSEQELLNLLQKA